MEKISKEQDYIFDSQVTTPEKIVEVKKKRQVINLRDSIHNASKAHILPDLPAVLESQETKKFDKSHPHSV